MTLIIFTNIISNSGFFNEFSNRSSMIVLLCLILTSLLVLACQVYLILIIRKNFLKTKFQNKSYKYSVYFAFSLVILSFTVFPFIIKDMILNQSYDLLLYQFVTIYIVIGSICILIISIFKFLQWMIKRRNLILSLYTISYLSLFITLILVLFVIYDSDIESWPIKVYTSPTAQTVEVDKSLATCYYISSFITFILLWITTSILLKAYLIRSKKISKTNYWILIFVILIVYILSSDFFYNNIVSSDIFYNKIIKSYNFQVMFLYILYISKSVAGIFFSLPFIFMSKYISNNNLKFYLLLSGSGIMILISSLQLGLFFKFPYPPFNFVIVVNIFISLYLIFIGFIFSAKSISDDKLLLLELKNQIKKSSFLFLKGIGSVEWQGNVEKIVRNIQRRTDISKFSIESSMSKKEIEEYVVDILDEIKQKNEKFDKE